jgi:hypothetical protein
MPAKIPGLFHSFPSPEQIHTAGKRRRCNKSPYNKQPRNQLPAKINAATKSNNDGFWIDLGITSQKIIALVAEASIALRMPFRL